MVTEKMEMQISDWKIDESAGRPILTYKGCSVIEAEDAHFVLSALEAALSTGAEPVATVAEMGVGGMRVLMPHPPGSTQRLPIGTKLYAAPPAPSVAVKALEWQSRGRKNGDTYANSVVGQYSVGDIWGEIKSLLRTIVDGQDDDQVIGVHETFEEAKAAAQADYEARIRSALSAQVQDVAIPKGYAAIHAHTVRQAATRAENDKDTLHLAGSLYDAMRWIEAMADKQFVPEEITREMDYAGHDKFVDVSSTRYTGSDPHREIFNAMLAAAPAAKQVAP